MHSAMPVTGSQLQAAEPQRKRRRKIWSCTECRRRKVQCDRLFPVCGRCSRSGNSACCVYLDDVPTTSATDPSQLSDANDLVRGRCGGPGQSSSSQGDQLTLEKLAERVHRLESSLSQYKTALAEAVRPHAPLVVDNNFDTHCGTLAPDDRSLDPPLRGKGFATKFNGSTHTSALLNQVPGLRQFTREAFDKFPAIDQIRRAVHHSETWNNTASPVTVESLRALLPPRPETDALVEAYLQTFEFVYHILHLPDFKKDYKDLWEEGGSRKPHFVTVVLLIVAIALCLTSTAARAPGSERPPSRDRATRLIQACENWFQLRPLRYAHLLDFQAGFLLLLARQLNGRRYKQTWSNAGKLVRNFMSAGLHREGSSLGGDISSLDRELRRRIWAAAAEFELQASLEQGMTPMPWMQQSDILPPKNIPDESFEDLVDLSELTRTLNPSWYLSTSTLSLSFRHSLTSLLNDPHAVISFLDVKEHTERIISYLSAVPPYSTLKAEPISALLRINLQQYQLVLHLRQATQSTSPAERDFSLMVMWNSAREIITTHRELLANASNMLELLCGDQFRAALSLCYVYVACKSMTNITFLTLPDHDFFLFMRDATTLIQNKTLRFSGDQRQLWITTASQAFMKAFNEPHRRDHFLKLAVEEFIASFDNEKDISSQPASKTTTAESAPLTEAPLEIQPPDDPIMAQDIFHDRLDWSGWEMDGLDTLDLVDFLDFD
ncbi:hypothetical protein ASPVEDRAFT_328578 [Aspergillus versicolor CBS 583.65]|uniref:Zn(2)-C6 fungal-type domain-containing protein n=1 Tax=Aspergillus versicolor CBS 583.65 TaxID=1036611 RepID=A0A1L9PYP7_ASPVE|nr:uncharacterized protein ASPVEDRAFT_328578 [Aspergillus versicolor CBS 583.65]OJJ06556.1 hypothetical protein ASPVEDRAFT_328578 [Aspergillus versicolor CBS 583.65]